MSFFKELKEDIVQSVNELGESLEESVVDTDIEKSETLEQEVQEEMDSLLKDEGLLLDVPAEDEVPAVEPLEADAADEELQEEELQEDVSDSGYAEPAAEEETDPLEMLEEQQLNEVEQEVSDKMDENLTNVMPDMEDKSGDAEMYNSEETTVITKGTTISGGIKSDTSLIVKGVIEGDVECQGKLTVTGRVAGNSTASEIYVNTPRMNGNLVSKGSVKVDVGTIVIGNISGASVVVAGAGSSLA